MSRRAFEFWLDALLLVLFVLALSPRMTGLALHEWIGIVFGLPVVVHLLLSWTWITGAIRRVFASAGSRARVNLLLNATLFVLIAVEIVSGVAISQVAGPSLGFATINDRSWRALHNQTLNLTHLVVGLHVAMNWQWIVATYAHDKSYDNFPRYAASICNTPAWARKYADFFGPKEGEIALKRNIQIGLAEIDTRVRWLQRDLPAMQRFFISANH